jgi:hypothetical protein
MATKTFVGGTAGNIWGATANWSPTGIPVAADDVIFNAASPGVTVSTSGVCVGANFTGYGNTLSFTSAGSISVGASGLTLSSGMGITCISPTAGGVIVMATLPNNGTGSIATNGCVIPRLQIGSVVANSQTNNFNINGTCTVSESYSMIYTTSATNIRMFGGTVAITGGTATIFTTYGGNSTLLLSALPGNTITFNHVVAPGAWPSGFSNPIVIAGATGSTARFVNTLHLTSGCTFTYVSGGVNTVGHILYLNGTPTLNTGGMEWNSVFLGLYPGVIGAICQATSLSNINVGADAIFGNVANSFVTFPSGGSIVLIGNRIAAGASANYSWAAQGAFTSRILLTGTGTRAFNSVGVAGGNLTNGSLDINMSGGTCVFSTVGAWSWAGSSMTSASTGTFFNATAQTFILSGTNTFAVSGLTAGTLTVSGTFTNNAPLGVAGTATMSGRMNNNSSFVVNNMALAAAANVAFAGTAGWTCSNLICTTAGRSITLAAGVTYTTTSSANMVGLTGSRVTMTSDSPTARAVWTLGPGATQSIIYTNGTRIDSSAAQTIWAYAGALTSTINWNNRGFVPTSGYPFVSS